MTNMKKSFSVTGIFFIAILLGSCLSVDPPCTRAISSRLLDVLDKPRLQSDMDIIDQYLQTNNQTAVKDPSGIRYTILQQGTGETPCLESIVSASYTGKLLSTGKVFDSSVSPIDFPLTNVILGWQLAFLKFNVGTKAVIYIPSQLAYGSNPRTNIPANSILVFEVNFTAVK